jgi:hypothetical protein
VVEHLQLVDTAYPLHSLHGRADGRGLIHLPDELAKGTGDAIPGDVLMKAQNAHVLLVPHMKGVEDPDGTPEGDGQDARHPGIEGAAMCRLCDP